MFVCPPVEVDPLIQVLSEDGSAWRLVQAPEGSCLYLVDDRDEVRLVKVWEGKVPDSLLPLSDAVVAVGDRWLARVDGEGARWIGGSLPDSPERACEVEGELRVEAGGRSWGVADSHLIGPLREACTPDPAQAFYPTGAAGTR